MARPTDRATGRALPGADRVGVNRSGLDREQRSKLARYLAECEARDRHDLTLAYVGIGAIALMVVVAGWVLASGLLR